MASTYTDNSGIEKPGTGDQSGTWGDTTNTNFDIIDRALNGVGAITLSGTTHTLTTTDGALSDGGYRVLVLGGSPDGTNTITISPNDQDKFYIVHNNSGESAIFSQGTGSNVTVLDGQKTIIFADGAGAGAAVTEVTYPLSRDSSPQLSGNLDVNGNSLVSTSNGNIVLAPNGTGDVQLDADTVRVGDSNADATVTTNGTGDLTLNTNGGTNSGSITIADGSNGDITVSPNGTGTVVINTDLDVDNININANTISSTNSNGDVVVDPNGTGNVKLGNFEFDADQTVGSSEDNHVLTYDDSTGEISLEALPAAASITAPTMQVFTSSGTWTKPSGCTTVKVTVVGGGGGSGAGGGGSGGYSGGGGGGGTAIEYIDVSSVSSVSVTVGSGGAGGAPSSSGSSGGTSSFGSYCSATGGSGSAASRGGTDNEGDPFSRWKVGGAGGIGSNGDINMKGQRGTSAASGPDDGAAGVGGASHMGASGNYGGGGDGSSSSSGGTTGGGGIVVVEEYYT